VRTSWRALLQEAVIIVCQAAYVWVQRSAKSERPRCPEVHPAYHCIYITHRKTCKSLHTQKTDVRSQTGARITSFCIAIQYNQLPIKSTRRGGSLYGRHIGSFTSKPPIHHHGTEAQEQIHLVYLSFKTLTERLFLWSALLLFILETTVYPGTSFMDFRPST
jgi:hypothetical protein